MTALFVALGGALGALARWSVTRSMQAWLGPAFPWGTLAVNVAGCVALAYIGTAAARTPPTWLTPPVRDALAVGFLGALTTFSTFGFDTFRTWERGELGLAAVNVAANLLLGLGGCWLGVWLAKSA